MKHVLLLYACLASCIVLAFDKVQGADKVRTWTDVQGRTMQAEFVREVDGDVAFLKDGKLITLPLERLSEADQKLIRELEANKVLAEEEKPAGALPAFVDPTVRSEKQSADLGSAGSKGETAETRVWTDTRGNKFTAKFVRVHEGNVVLLRGARTMTMAFDSLSAGDQAYVREVLTARGEAGLIPPVAGDGQNSQPGRGTPPFDAPPQAAQEPRAGGESAIHEQSGGAAEAQRRDAERQAESPSPQTAAQNNPQPAEQVQPGGASPATEARGVRRRRLKFDDPRQVISALVGMPIVAAIGSLIGAIILRAAVYWVLGSHLSYGDAYGTVFLLYIANFFVGFLFALLTSALPDETFEMYSWVTLPIAFLVQSGIISSRLETSFGEACLVSLAMFLVMLAILAVIVVIVLATFTGIQSTS